MGRKRTGSVKVLPDGRGLARIAGEYLGIYDTPELAWEHIDAALALDSGKAPDTVRVYGRKVLAARDQEGAVRSIADDMSLWRTHVETAFFADWELRAVRPRHVEKWLKQLAQKEAVSPRRSGSGKVAKTVYKALGRKLSRETMSHARRVLKVVFAQARIDGKVNSNPVDAVPVPKTRAKVSEDEDEWTYLLLDEIDTLFKVLPDARHKAFFGIAIYAGLRQAEILGLRWADLVLDSSRPTIKVRKGRAGPLKTAGSRRDVPMLPYLRELLLAWKAQAALARKARGDHASRPFELVFPSDHGGPYARGYDMHWDDRRERRVVRLPGPVRKVARVGDLHINKGWRSKAEIRHYVTFHDLRHTCASHLVMGSWTDAPLSLMQTKAWLGHTSLKTTQRYAHVAPGNLHDAIAAGDDSWKVSGNDFRPPRMDRARKHR